MTITINPPAFNKTKSYDRYKQELLAWKEVTDLAPRKQATVVALSLPEADETNIRDKVFDQLTIEEPKKENGLNLLVKFLDTHLAKDDLSDSLEKFTDFENYERVEGETIDVFNSKVDAKYRKMQKKNMELPSEILAFKLLQKARISEKEKLLVLTGMNYGNRASLYYEAKISLKKLMGGQLLSNYQYIQNRVGKLGETKEVFVVAGDNKEQKMGFQKMNAACDQEGKRGRGGGLKMKSPKAFCKRTHYPFYSCRRAEKQKQHTLGKASIDAVIKAEFRQEKTKKYENTMRSFQKKDKFNYKLQAKESFNAKMLNKGNQKYRGGDQDLKKGYKWENIYRNWRFPKDYEARGTGQNVVAVTGMLGGCSVIDRCSDDEDIAGWAKNCSLSGCQI